MPQGMGARAVAEFVAWARRQGIAVHASWPNTIRFRAYQDHPGFSALRDFFAGLHVSVIGAPQDAMFPRHLHYNTNYHLNVEGIRRHTDRFVEGLRAVGLVKSASR